MKASQRSVGAPPQTSLRFIKKANKLIARLWSPTTKKLFVFAIPILFFYLQANLNFQVLQENRWPYEIDDAYQYILKGSEISKGCFFQNCRALNDLRAQLLSPSETSELASAKNRQYHRIFVTYHPLHSFILAALAESGLSLEDAFLLMYIGGTIFMLLATIAWVYSVWGIRVGVIALLLLSGSLTGAIRYISPSTLSLGIAFVAWCIILRGSKKIQWWLIPLLIAMVLMHQVGKVYAIVTLIIYVFFQRRPSRPQEWITPLTMGVIILLAFITPLLISKPELKFDPVAFYPGNWNYLESWQASLPVTILSIQNWFAQFGNSLVAFAFIVIGVYGMLLSKNSRPFLTGLLLFFCVTGSLFYIVPWYGAIAFNRVWPPLSIFGVGAVAAATILITEAVWIHIHKLAASRKKPGRSGEFIFNLPGWHTLSIILLCVLLASIFITYMYRAVNTYTDILAGGQVRPDGIFNAEQLKLIDTGRPQTIVYLEETSMYYFLSHVGQHYGAIFVPTLNEISEFADWQEERGDEIQYLVAGNPIYQFPHEDREGGILLKSTEELAFRRSRPFETTGFEILISERKAALSFQVVIDGGDVRTFNLGAGPAEWVNIGQEGLFARTVQLYVRHKDSQMEILGIRLERSQAAFWPWHTDLEVTLSSAAGVESNMIFSKKTLVFYSEFGDFEVLDDRGYSVLIRLKGE